MRQMREQGVDKQEAYYTEQREKQHHGGVARGVYDVEVITQTAKSEGEADESQVLRAAERACEKPCGARAHTQAAGASARRCT